MYKDSVNVQLPHGLHLRPAANLVARAKQFKSQITLSVGSASADAKSLFELQNLEIVQGTILTIAAEGEDEAQAVQALITQLNTPLDSTV